MYSKQLIGTENIYLSINGIHGQGRSGVIIAGWLATQKGPVQSVADTFI